MKVSGSRYAPVGVCAVANSLTDKDLFVGKPCEASAFREYSATTEGRRPLIASFFCAGTPSQHTTDRLVDSGGIDPGNVRELRYRGGGWPGKFVVGAHSGELFELSYKESWGQHLGKSLQWRCKVCPDGTGSAADIAVGDYWNSDAQGYPVFDEGAGRSVIIARTVRGQEALQEAARQGVIVLSAIDLDDAARVQPLQVDRRITMAGRIVGTVLAGRRIPVFSGFGLLRLLVKHPIRNIRACFGTYLRVKGRRR